MTVAFSFARVPPIHCGIGTLKQITAWLRSRNAQSVLLVTGRSSLQAMGQLSVVERLINDAGASHHHVVCDGEPSTELVMEGLVVTARTSQTGSATSAFSKS